MTEQYLHNHKDFESLIRIVAEEKHIQPYLIEKDYWIMQVLYGLQQQGYDFELKGGTSLSKGYKIINRFSEDIDVQINPPDALGVITNTKKIKAAHVKSRQDYYDGLARQIKIDGIVNIVRDTEFDDLDYYRSAGIRLKYHSYTEALPTLKEGILLEVGFDDVNPNSPIDISSWAYDYAMALPNPVDVIDNRAKAVKCYHPGYTFVEKLQTVVTKFRIEQSSGKKSKNFLRQYYDLYELLNHKEVLDFIGTEAYQAHKEKRFRGADKEVPLQENEALRFSSKRIFASYETRYLATSDLYYNGQTAFREIIDRIHQYLPQL